MKFFLTSMVLPNVPLGVVVVTVADPLPILDGPKLNGPVMVAASAVVADSIAPPIDIRMRAKNRFISNAIFMLFSIHVNSLEINILHIGTNVISFLCKLPSKTNSRI